LTTIPDGTINTTSTSIGLPGKNYAGYGQQLDNNFVHQLENFAAASPPPNALRGQLWFNTNNSVLYVCPTDGESNSLAWLSLTSTSSGGTTSFGQVTVTGNLTSNNLTVTNGLTANSAALNFLTVSANGTFGNIFTANANVTGTLTTNNITTGSATTTGTITGTWTINGGLTGNAAVITGGNVTVPNVAGAGIKADNFYYTDGSVISFAGSYTNANVAAFLPTYGGTILTTTTQATTLTSGAAGTAGSITGNWTLTAGSRLNATYADLAERFAADAVYDAGTVVQLGGKDEITAVQYELSEDVFGVISSTAAYLMNASAGTDDTHPAVAVSGRVQVKVTGEINKGDRLVSAGTGIARAAKLGEATSFNTIGRALEAKTTSGVGYVEAFVAIK
jgi:hypothetical protein